MVALGLESAAVLHAVNGNREVDSFAADRLREGEEGRDMTDRLTTKQRAKGQWHDILPKLIPDLDPKVLRGRGGPCPMCGGRDRFRFTRNLRDEDAMWLCNQCQPHPRPGIDLVMHYHGVDLLGASRLVDGVIGRGYTPVQVRADRKVDVLHRHRFPFEMWQRGHLIQPGDVSDLWLRRRGLGMDSYPHCLRESPSERYRDMEDGDRISFHPCMLALVRDVDGRPITIARTYLAPDGDKADVPRPRKAVSPFGPGPSIRLAPAAPLMGIAEGIETSLAASKLFQMPVWSVLNAYGIETFNPPSMVERLFIFADNDPKGMRGQLAAAEAVRRLIDRVDVEVCVPSHGKDWCDTLMRWRDCGE
jgi:putative DNA primase/helicase